MFFSSHRSQICSWLHSVIPHSVDVSWVNPSHSLLFLWPRNQHSFLFNQMSTAAPYCHCVPASFFRHSTLPIFIFIDCTYERTWTRGTESSPRNNSKFKPNIGSKSTILLCVLQQPATSPSHNICPAFPNLQNWLPDSLLTILLPHYSMAYAKGKITRKLLNDSDSFTQRRNFSLIQFDVYTISCSLCQSDK